MRRVADGLMPRDDKENAMKMKRMTSGIVALAAMGLGSAMACPPEGTWTDDSGNVLKLGGVGEPQVRVFRHRGGVRGEELPMDRTGCVHIERSESYLKGRDGDSMDLDVLVDRGGRGGPERFELRDGGAEGARVFTGRPRVRTFVRQIEIGPDGGRVEKDHRWGEATRPGVERRAWAESREMGAARAEIMAKIESLHAEIARLEKSLDAISRKDRVMRAGPERQGPGLGVPGRRGVAPEIRIERRGFIVGPDSERLELTPRVMEGLRIEERRGSPAAKVPARRALEAPRVEGDRGERLEIELEEIPDEILEMMGVGGHEIVHRTSDPV